MNWTAVSFEDPPDYTRLLVFSEKYQRAAIAWKDGYQWCTDDPRFERSEEPDGMMPVSHFMVIVPPPRDTGKFRSLLAARLKANKIIFLTCLLGRKKNGLIWKVLVEANGMYLTAEAELGQQMDPYCEKARGLVVDAVLAKVKE